MTQDYKLPPLPAEFRSANNVPVERATITRGRMQEILQAAIENFLNQSGQYITNDATRQVAIELALQQRGEPVAWRTYDRKGWYVFSPTLEDAERDFPGKDHQPLYTAPQPAAPAQEMSEDEIMQAMNLGKLLDRPLLDDDILMVTWRGVRDLLASYGQAPR